MIFVQLLLLGVNLSNSFSQGCQANRAARAQRAQRAQLLASTPVHRVRASRVITCDGAINASAKYNTEPCLTFTRANKLSYHVAQWRETVHAGMLTA